jgi:hypothetical protein
VKRRLIEAARDFLPETLQRAVRAWSGETVLRIRRLEVDVTIDAASEPIRLADSLARAIANELRRAESSGATAGGSDGVVCYASQAIYLAALVEALGEGRAADRWWISDAEGLRFLSSAQAIRTALLADPRTGLEALASLPTARRMAVLQALSPVEAERTLHGFAGGASVTVGVEECVAAIARAAPELPEAASPLALFVGAFAYRPSLLSPALAAAASLWVEMKQTRRESEAAVAKGGPIEEADSTSRLSRVATITTPIDAPRILTAVDIATRNRPAQSETVCCFTQFGGLLLLLPDLGANEIARTIGEGPDAPPDLAALVNFAVLGVCAGRPRFDEWLADGLWRELFGLDAQASSSAMAARLAAIPAEALYGLRPLIAPLDRPRDARFLLAQRRLLGSRENSRVVAGLASAALKRFAQRLIGFGEASAPFLWANLLATSAVLERRPGGWSARLSRSPLDVLLSLARIVEGSVNAPSGARIEITRVAQ